MDVWVELDPLTPYATVHLKHELERIARKAEPLLADPALLDQEEG